MKETTIGLLPLYLQLYDEVDPGKRPRVEKFYQTIAAIIMIPAIFTEVTGCVPDKSVTDANYVGGPPRTEQSKVHCRAGVKRFSSQDQRRQKAAGCIQRYHC